MKEYTLYNGKYTIQFHEKLGQKKHVYILRDQELLSVTKIVGILGKPLLIPWAVNLAVDHLQKNYKRGFLNGDDFENARSLHNDVKKSAGTVGSTVHRWIECYLGKIPFAESLDERVQKSVNAFLQWEKDNKITWEAVERVIYSPRHKYTGRYDAVAVIGGKRAIIDFKTSSGCYPEYFYQMAGYLQALKEEFSEDTPDDILVIRFDKETGEYHEHWVRYEDYIDGFYACLTLKKLELSFNNKSDESKIA